MNKFNIKNSLLNDYRKLKDDYLFSRIRLNIETITSYYKIQKQNLQDNKKTSYRFNIFNYFEPNETMHSKLLALLLNPKAEHGQGYLFLKTFLDKIGIEYNKSDSWIVTAEIGRIDILLKCLNRDSVVIIENKSNGAVDQYAQIYRYWYQEMFLPIEMKKNIKTLENKKNFQIIYLVPNTQKKIENHSLLKPDYESFKNQVLPNEISIEHLNVITFDKEIIDWLDECKNQLDESNYRLKEYLTQYIEKWETN